MALLYGAAAVAPSRRLEALRRPRPPRTSRQRRGSGSRLRRVALAAAGSALFLPPGERRRDRAGPQALTRVCSAACALRRAARAGARSGSFPNRDRAPARRSDRVLPDRAAPPGGVSRRAGPRTIRADGVVRPLLSVSRAEILEFLEERGIEYRRDSSNGNLHLERNRIRRDLARRRTASGEAGEDALLRRLDRFGSRTRPDRPDVRPRNRAPSLLRTGLVRGGCGSAREGGSRARPARHRGGGPSRSPRPGIRRSPAASGRRSAADSWKAAISASRRAVGSGSSAAAVS